MKRSPAERLVGLIEARVRRWVTPRPGPDLEARFGAAEKRASRLAIGAYLHGMRVDLMIATLRGKLQR